MKNEFNLFSVNGNYYWPFQFLNSNKSWVYRWDELWFHYFCKIVIMTKLRTRVTCLKEWLRKSVAKFCWMYMYIEKFLFFKWNYCLFQNLKHLCTWLAGKCWYRQAIFMFSDCSGEFPFITSPGSSSIGPGSSCQYTSRISNTYDMMRHKRNKKHA